MSESTNQASHEIKVRHAKPSDFIQIKNLYAQISNYSSTLQLPHPSDKLWEDRLAGYDKNHFNLVAEVEISDQQTKIVGQIGLHVGENHRRKHTANFGMGVDENHRGQGIGSLLLSEAINLATNWLGITRIELEVYTDNEAAIALYKKHQFEIEGTAKNYAFRDGKLVDSHFMARLI